MDVRAILLVKPPAANGKCAETLGGVPVALLPALGRPLVQHMAERLKRSGVEAISVISEPVPAAPHFLRAAMSAAATWETASGQEFWRAAESAFTQHVQAGAEVVLVMRLGAYAEIALAELLRFHLAQRNRVTAVDDGRTPLDLFLISASRRNEAAFLFRHELADFRTPCVPFTFRGHVNRMLDARDLRQLVLDGFAQRVDIWPAGREWKPGIWVEDGARIQSGARILAPAFIGARSRIGVAAVLTRGACIEHHCWVDCGTVVEDSTLLPYTSVGAGLDIAHSVVGFRRLAHLRRNVEVEITDPKLLSMRPAHAGLRALSSAAALAAFLPTEFVRGLFAPSHREQPATLLASVKASSPALKAPSRLEEPDTTQTAVKFPANLAVARRYGDE